MLSKTLLPGWSWGGAGDWWAWVDWAKHGFWDVGVPTLAAMGLATLLPVGAATWSLGLAAAAMLAGWTALALGAGPGLLGLDIGDGSYETGDVSAPALASLLAAPAVAAPWLLHLAASYLAALKAEEVEEMLDKRRRHRRLPWKQGLSDIARHVIWHTLNHRKRCKRHPTTWRAISARPYVEGARAAAGPRAAALHVRYAARRRARGGAHCLSRSCGRQRSRLSGARGVGRRSSNLLHPCWKRLVSALEINVRNDTLFSVSAFEFDLRPYNVDLRVNPRRTSARRGVWRRRCSTPAVPRAHGMV